MGYHEYGGGVQYTREYHEYTGGIPRCMYVVIMSTPGVFSTLGDTMSTPGEFDTNEKKPPPRFQGFLFSQLLQLCSCIFGSLDGLLKFLYQVARAQTLTHFLFYL